MEMFLWVAFKSSHRTAHVYAYICEETHKPLDTQTTKIFTFACLHTRGCRGTHIPDSVDVSVPVWIYDSYSLTGLKSLWWLLSDFRVEWSASWNDFLSVWLSAALWEGSTLENASFPTCPCAQYIIITPKSYIDGSFLKRRKNCNETFTATLTEVKAWSKESTVKVLLFNKDI